MAEIHSIELSPSVCERFRAALEDIALLDEADGHELTQKHAFEAVAIATSTLGKHPSEILAARYADQPDAIPIADAMRWARNGINPTSHRLADEVDRLNALLARVTDAYESTKTYDPALLCEARAALHIQKQSEPPPDDICAACGAARREHMPGGTRWGEMTLCGVFIPSLSTGKGTPP